MILQALTDYYERADLAPSGWEYKPIQFLIVISVDGKFVALNDRRSPIRKRAQPMLVPASEIRSGNNAWMQPNLLWDHYGFVLGEQKRKPSGDSDPSDSPEKVAKQFDAFRNRISILAQRYPDSKGLAAINSFYSRAEHVKVVETAEATEMFKIPGANLTFQLAEAIEPILHEQWVTGEALAEDDDDATDTSDGHTGFCLVSARVDSIARLHPKINGVCDKPTALAAANTIQYPAFSSFGKAQGYNFPVGKPAAFAYTTALNHLLARDSRQRVQIGDASTVFWTEQPSDFETLAPDLFGEPPKDDPDRGTRAFVSLYRALHDGHFATDDDPARCHMLGLAPNAARIAVRFWQTGTIAELGRLLRRHFDDLEVVRGPNDPRHLSLFCLLTAIAVQGKADNIPPNLGGEIVRAVFSGEDAAYPAALLNAAVGRCRAEQRVTHPRAATIKAVLNRNIRRRNKSSVEQEFSPMLDQTNPTPPTASAASSPCWKKSRKKPAPASTPPSATAITAPPPVHPSPCSPRCCD
jgi:CRISPR-associated protein Csd1